MRTIIHISLMICWLTPLTLTQISEKLYTKNDRNAKNPQTFDEFVELGKVELPIKKENLGIGESLERELNQLEENEKWQNVNDFEEKLLNYSINISNANESSTTGRESSMKEAIIVENDYDDEKTEHDEMESKSNMEQNGASSSLLDDEITVDTQAFQDSIAKERQITKPIIKGINLRYSPVFYKKYRHLFDDLESNDLKAHRGESRHKTTRALIPSKNTVITSSPPLATNQSAKQHSFKTEFKDANSQRDTTAKHRGEGTFQRALSTVRSGRIGDPSTRISQRFIPSSLFDGSKHQQIESARSNLIEDEVDERPFNIPENSKLFVPFKAVSAAVLQNQARENLPPTDEVNRVLKSLAEIGKGVSPLATARIHSGGPSARTTTPLKTQKKNLADNNKGSSSTSSPILFHNIEKMPAFCRRCFKFWKTVAASRQDVNDELIFEYCCTRGSNKSQLFLNKKWPTNS